MPAARSDPGIVLNPTGPTVVAEAAEFTRVCAGDPVDEGLLTRRSSSRERSECRMVYSPIRPSSPPPPSPSPQDDR